MDLLISVVEHGMALRPGPAAAIALVRAMLLVLLVRILVLWVLWRVPGQPD
jgi:hypothetical protein